MTSSGRNMTMAHALFAAQEGICFYCFCEFTGPPAGRKNRATRWSRDHVNPASAGNGRTRNLVLACHACQQVKGNRTPTQAELVRADAIHAEALRLIIGFNGGAPPEWTGDRAPTPTRRAAEIAERKAQT